MSDLIITGQRTYQGYTTITYQGKRNEIDVTYGGILNRVGVVYKNPSHKAYRGLGKTFEDWTEAKRAYKSSEMQAILQHAESIAAAKPNSTQES